MSAWLLIGVVYIYGQYHSVSVPNIASQQACERLAAEIDTVYRTDVPAFRAWHCFNYADR